ncbi:uncharacterized protein Boh1 [Eurosta solidaginis]|uniref:uncharacterized protein Boh1 n=1 Tax=Eurosta solidaginis TaxID=178769 RepID=UPI0035305E1F
MDSTIISNVPLEAQKTETILVSADSCISSPKAVVAHQMAVTEVPEMIAVETIFISDQLARQKKIELSEALVLSESYIVDDAEDDSEDDADVYLLQTQDFGTMVQPDAEDFAGQTDGPNPQRDREIQTMKFSSKKDIGIQCECETDLFFEDMQRDGDPLDGENINSQRCYAQFLVFVQNNTNIYSGSKTECMKCGEVCKNFKQTLSHMAIHWGPSTLCERCGQSIEHARLLYLHQCEFAPPNKNAQKQCPLYTCGIILKSNKKLLNHLNHHLNSDFSQCLIQAAQRKLSFTKKISARQQSPKKTALRGCTRDTLRCQICLIRFKSTFAFVRHRQKCIKRFMERLKVKKRKNMSANSDKLLILENFTK